MVNELKSGPCVAMKIMHEDPNIDVVNYFKNFCGPTDSVIHQSKINFDLVKSKNC